MSVGLILGYVGFAAIFLVAGSMFHSEKSLGFILVIVLPTSLFFVLLLLSKISTVFRTLISLSASAVGGAFLFAIDDYSFFGVYETLGLLANLLLAYLAIYFIFASIFYGLRINKTGFIESLTSFFILAASVGISVGFQNAKLDFYWKVPRYNAVIQLIKNGEIIPDAYGNFKAPLEYGHIVINLSNYTDEQYFYVRQSYYIEHYVYSESKKMPKGFKCEKFMGQEFWFDCIELDP